MATRTPAIPGDPHPAVQPPTVLPDLPTDVITNIAVGPIDQARGVMAELGLRKHRVFLASFTYTGPDFGAGNLTSVVYDEIVPAPKVRVVSDFRIAQSGGVLQAGAVEISKITL